MSVIHSIKSTILLVWVGLLTVAQLHAKDIDVSNLNDLINNLNKSNVSYRINSSIDLKGKEIQLPIGSTVNIFKGKLLNGILVGNETILQADSNLSIGVVIRGNWKASVINDLWFDDKYLEDNAIMSNINSLQSDIDKNVIHLYRDYLVDIDSKSYSAFVLRSNTELYIHSSIKIKPNNYAKYGIIDITSKKNVSIQGGLIVGDVGKHVYIENSTSEWGMGINVVASDKVTINDCTISFCTGDGIYLGGYSESNLSVFDNACHDVTINHVICDRNRRQGLSIVHAKDIIVIDCLISNTGQVEHVNPGCGIDIEPNISKNRNMAVSNVQIIGCTFEKNKGQDIATAHYVNESSFPSIKDVFIKNSKMNGDVSIRCSSVLIEKSDFPRVCIIVSDQNIENVVIENCTISRGLYIRSAIKDHDHPQNKGVLKNVTIRRCNFQNIERNNGKAIIALSGDISRIKKMSFIDCYFNDQFKKYNNRMCNRSINGVCLFRNCTYSSHIH